MDKELKDFFKTIKSAKKEQKESMQEILGNSFFEDFVKPLAKEYKKPKDTAVVEDKIIEEEIVVEEVKEVVVEEVKEVVVEEEKTLIEKSLGLLSEPSNTKQQKDPLTPLDQNFVTFDQLQKHYKTSVERIQQQLSTLGGGGETRLEFLDDVNRNSVKSDHKFLRYDAPSEKWIGAYAGQAPFISSTTYVTSSSYTITENDYYIGVNYSGAVTITLPIVTIEGTTYIVKDELGEASKGTNRYITILPSGSDKIDGQDRAILAYDFGSLTFVYRSGWRVV